MTFFGKHQYVGLETKSWLALPPSRKREGGKVRRVCVNVEEVPPHIYEPSAYGALLDAQQKIICWQENMLSKQPRLGRMTSNYIPFNF